jgi:hypothetical protein
MTKKLFLSLGALCLGASLTQAQTTLTNGLVAYWPLDTVNGNTTPDLALGNNLTCINCGATNLITGERGDAFQLTQPSGLNQYLEIFHSTNYEAQGLPIYTTNGYTISFWVQGLSTQAANHIPFAEVAYAGSMLMDFNTRSTHLAVFLRDNAGTTVINNVSSSAAVFDTSGTTWHNVTFTDLNGVCHLYIDGNLDSANVNYTAPSTGAEAPTITTIGALVRSSGAADPFAGGVDEVMAWNRVLSQSEIQNEMANGIPEPIAGTPPEFVTSPLNTTNSMGDRVVLSANVFGNQPMSYQWYSNNIILPGQTTNALILTSQNTPSTNYYTLVASNSVGTNISTPAMVVVLPDLPATNIDSGLVGYWPLNVVSNSTTTPDLVSQNDFQLTNMSSANLVAGEFGNALSFDGATQFGYEVTGLPVYDLTTTYTVAFWVNGAANQADKQVFANGNNATGNYFFIGTDNTGASGKVDVRINPGLADTVSTNTAFDGTWHHIAWVDQNGTGLLYIDGVLDPAVYSYGQGALGALGLNNTSIAALLADPLRDYYAGDIDDVATWNRRLSYTEIQSIIANGIPTPPLTVKPSVSTPSTQPSVLTNGIYQGDTVTMSASGSGTPPLSYQWYDGSTKISGAVTNTLTLSNVQPANSGSYTLVVTNAAGAVTSSVVVLTVTPYHPGQTGSVLQVEFNFAAGPVVQPGFSSMTLSGNPATFGGPEITLSTVGATSLSDRARSTPTNNPPALTTADLYQQFIFSTSATAGTGINMLIQRLASNTTYGVTFWSFDQENQGIEDWYEVSSGTPVTVTYEYAFDGAILPTQDGQDTFGALVTSSPTGTLDFQGLQDGYASTVSVFLNAMQLVANPKIQISKTQIAADGNLQFTVTLQYVGEQIDFLQSSTLALGSWQNADGNANIISANGLTAVVEFPLSGAQQFYQVVSP